MTVEVPLLLMLQVLIISLGLFEALCVGSPEYVVCKNSLSETSITWERVSDFDVFFALFFDHFRLRPLLILSFDCLIEVLASA